MKETEGQIDESISELLKPRYKVSVEGYPDMRFKPGEILVLNGIETGNLDEHYNGKRYWLSPQKTRWYEDYFQKFPSIFQPLPWYADRKPEDMPEYVKRESGKVFKIDRYSNISDNIAYLEREENKTEFIHLNNTLPATQSDYDTYINQKQN